MSIVAQYATECPACERDIKPGDRIESGQDGPYMHQSCYREALLAGYQPAPDNNPLCRTCFMYHAGECF